VRYQNTVLGDLLKVLPRRRFAAIVERHKGDKYIKGFSSWDHLVTLISAQLGGLSSLREVQTVWNAQAAHHYHLGTGLIRRSTLSDANRRRPSATFAETFAALSALADCWFPRHGTEVLRLIDATPIPLTKPAQMGRLERPDTRPEGPYGLRSRRRSASASRDHSGDR
jgi:hypothetical protein